MFDFVRKNNKIMQLLLFLLIFPSFVLFGVDGYNRMREKGEVVARVDGRDITRLDWDNAHKSEVERLRASTPTLDPGLLDSPTAKYATLERLVRERVLAAAAEKAHLLTSDQRLARWLQEDPAIATLRKPDGKLDIERYRLLVGSQGMTLEMFEASVRADLSARQVLAGFDNTGFAPAAVMDVALNAYFEQREVQVARFDAADFAARVNPTDADLESFYKSHPALFQAPEQADIEYVVLDLDTVRKSITLNEQDLKTYYEKNAARLAGQEERRASHILIAVPKDAGAAERQQAKAKAEELLAQARKAPDGFAELARKNSQDPGSAAKGGDLGFFQRGAMVKPFEDAAFALEKGGLSDVVESDFGYHIIKLVDIKLPRQRGYEEMKPEIEAEVMKQQAQGKFAELAEAFTNMVYEQSDGLKPVAERFKLELKSTSNVRRQPAPGATGVLGSPKFLAALFAPDSVDKRRNTEAIETAPNQLVAGRVTRYAAAHLLALTDVKERVRELARKARGAEQARKEGEARLAAWRVEPASATLPQSVTVSRDQPQKLPAPVVEAALRVDPAALPAFTGVNLGSQGYAVVKVSKIVAPDAAAQASARQGRLQYEQRWNSAESMAYYNMLKERFKAQFKVTKPAAKPDEDLAPQAG